MRSLPGKNRQLAFFTPAIAAEQAGLADDAVARDELGNCILAHRGADGARGSGCSNKLAAPFVGDQSARRDAQQRPPDF